MENLRLEDSRNVDINKYARFRKARISVYNKLSDDYVDDAMMLKAARMLGIVRQGYITTENEDESADVLDLAIREVKRDGKTALERAREDNCFTDEYELEYFKGMLSSEISLYSVIGLDYDGGWMCVRDELFKDKPSLYLYDENITGLAYPGMLLFTVVVNFFDIATVAGGAYFFAFDSRDLILRECFMRSKNKAIFKDSVKRFKLFFHLNRKYGGYERLEKCSRRNLLLSSENPF